MANASTPLQQKQQKLEDPKEKEKERISKESCLETLCGSCDTDMALEFLGVDDTFLNRIAYTQLTESLLTTCSFLRYGTIIRAHMLEAHDLPDAHRQSYDQGDMETLVDPEELGEIAKHCPRTSMLKDSTWNWERRRSPCKTQKRTEDLAHAFRLWSKEQSLDPSSFPEDVEDDAQRLRSKKTYLTDVERMQFPGVGIYDFDHFVAGVSERYSRSITYPLAVGVKAQDWDITQSTDETETERERESQNKEQEQTVREETVREEKEEKEKEEDDWVWVPLSSFGTTDNLLRFADASPFGDLDTQQTLFDRNVRHAFEIPASRLQWDPHTFFGENAFTKDLYTSFLQHMSHDLYSDVPVTLDLYKLNIYPTGGHFEDHQDTPRPGVVGTCVVVLPPLLDGEKDTFEGGELWINGKPLPACNESCGSTSSAIYAFYAHLMHRVAPVTRGTRMTLTFFIRPASTTVLPLDVHGSGSPVQSLLAQAFLQNLRAYMRHHPRVGFVCEHLYSPAELATGIWKGVDAKMMQLLYGVYQDPPEQDQEKEQEKEVGDVQLRVSDPTEVFVVHHEVMHDEMSEYGSRAEVYRLRRTELEDVCTQPLSAFRDTHAVLEHEKCVFLRVGKAATEMQVNESVWADNSDLNSEMFLPSRSLFRRFGNEAQGSFWEGQYHMIAVFVDRVDTPPEESIL
mmetsp:Transcript_28751/g.73522  ORF Transcript_28751/g.73522 Transcript_28751/m.73522 type:complete len:682 (-) Transcript_28751:92-2137(-)|eukprot:CAMPEP_0113884274 /NCGR_PEP_ID=MMETSP0780_2-20120614/10161_1 /TAXON_ID=652834 /ORGANISM="Palpitomonas bilix" /LENGTH=681 /DNA_ID=CAMNT_0000871865 /DNA_START=1003 /DNA_END=3048 /DNA_ORIENTATION=- /assembly_acc=CAM_ASM_000599